MSGPVEEPEFCPADAGAGVTLRLRVAAGAARRRVVGPHAGALKLSVTAAPERGRANREVVALLSETFAVPRGSVELVSGEMVPDKLVRLPLSREEALLRWRRFTAVAEG